MKVMKIALLAALAAPAFAGDAPDAIKEFLGKIADKDVGARYAARLSAPKFGAAAVVPLGELIVHKEAEVGRTARAALELIVHDAGKPGAEANRAPVAKELAKLLSKDRPAAIQREALYQIAFIGDDAAVPPVADLLETSADPKVSEAARQALERIPGKAAAQALVTACRTMHISKFPDLIYSLSKKGDPSLLKQFSAFHQDFPMEVRLAVLEANARLAVRDSIPLFKEEIGSAPAEWKGRVFDEYLRLADNLQADGAASAKGVYAEVLAKSALDYQREHALAHLCPAGKVDSMPLLAAALADPSPRLRRLATARIEAMPGPEALAAIRKAYDGAKGADRAAILRAIEARDAAEAKALAEKVAADPQPEVKLVALDILGRLDDPALADVCLRSAESGPEWIRPTAMKGYLAIAKKKLGGANAKAEALPLFAKALDLARDPGQRLEALRGVIAVGDPKEIGRLEGLLADSALGADAARGYVAFAAALGKAGDKAAAEKHLMKVATGDFPRDLKSKAGEELKALGIDPKGGVKAQGFVVDWWVVSPIANNDGKAMEAKLFPEVEVRLDAEEKIGPRRHRWQKFDQVVPDGVIDLVPLFRRGTNVVTYAYTELESPKAQEVLFKIGSDDGCALFFNGERVLFNPGPRSWKLDDDSVKCRLVAGKNKVLLKVEQGDGDWAFSFRVTDLKGEPLVLKAVVK
jgi:HEAT repeat protein